MLQRLCLSIFIGIIASLTMGSAASALPTFKSEERPSVAAFEIIDGAFVATGESVVVEGTVRGDVICAATNVLITGRVEGDVLCVGTTIKINGPVLGNVRVVGSSVEIASEVGGSVAFVGQNITFTPMARIGRDILMLGQSASIGGYSARDVAGQVGSLTLSNTVTGNVKVWTDSLTLSQGANLRGGLIYTSAQAAVLERPDAVKGQIVHNEVPAQLPQTFATNMLFSLFWFVSLALLGNALILFYPRVLQETGVVMPLRRLACLGWGLAGFFGLPLLALLAFVTIVGTPLGVAIVLVWLFGLLLAPVLVAHAVGQWLLKKVKVSMAPRLQHIISLVVGLLIISLLSVIPFVGVLLGWVITVFGMGGLLLFFMGRKKERAVVS